MNNTATSNGGKLLVKFANANEEELIPSNNIFVKGIPTNINVDALKALFGAYGIITETKILSGRFAISFFISY